jgi:hypothetical protein
MPSPGRGGAKRLNGHAALGGTRRKSGGIVPSSGFCCRRLSGRAKMLSRLSFQAAGYCGGMPSFARCWRAEARIQSPTNISAIQHRSMPNLTGDSERLTAPRWGPRP